MLTVGLFLLLYPTVSDYWNSFHQTNAITNYQEAIKRIDQDLYDDLINDANEYNEELSKTGNKCILNDLEKIKYNSLLTPSQAPQCSKKLQPEQDFVLKVLQQPQL